MTRDEAFLDAVTQRMEAGEINDPEEVYRIVMEHGRIEGFDFELAID